MNKNLSIDLEHGEYAENVELVIDHAIQAVAETGEGYYVNLVTPDTFGNPVDYLTEVLDVHFGKEITYQFIDQCGCGGYVLRVWRNQHGG